MYELTVGNLVYRTSTYKEAVQKLESLGGIGSIRVNSLKITSLLEVTKAVRQLSGMKG